jgi:hypothetical protein
MVNCKEEFLEEVVGKTLLCAELTYQPNINEDTLNRKAVLAVGYSDEERQKFLHDIDYDYEPGDYSCGQWYDIDGFIWYKDGSWSERITQGGFECWDHKKCPTPPKKIQGETLKLSSKPEKSDEIYFCRLPSWEAGRWVMGYVGNAENADEGLYFGPIDSQTLNGLADCSSLGSEQQ